MSLEAIARGHIERIEAFLDDDEKTLLSVRTAKGGEPIGARLLARLERNEARSIVMIALCNEYRSEASFFAEAAKTVAADVATADEELRSVGLGLADVESYRSPPDGAPAGAAAISFADWMERLQRRLGARVARFVVLIAPSEIHGRTAFAATLAGLVAATASPAVKYLLLDGGDDPLLGACTLPRPRSVWAPDLPAPGAAAHAFAPEARRMIVVPGQSDGAFRPERLRAALGRGLLVEVSAPLHDRWTPLAELEEAAIAAAASLAGERRLPLPPAAPRAGVEARFAEYMEALARTVSDGVALVCLHITATSSPELAEGFLLRLAQAASSGCVRYLVRIDLPKPPSLFRPAVVATHEIRFEPEMIISGYEEKLQDPDLPTVERVRTLSMLSGFVGAKPERSDGSRKRAVELASEAAALSRSLDAPHDRAMALLTLGNAQLLNEQLPLAREAYAMATKVALDAGSLPLAAHALGQVGVIHGRMGDYPRAAASLRAAANAFQKAAHPLGEAQMLLWLGDAEIKRDEPAVAVQAWLEVLDRTRRMPPFAGEGTQGFAAQAHERLAKAFERARDTHRAEEHRREARSLGGQCMLLEAF